jgi:hypothetical protein
MGRILFFEDLFADDDKSALAAARERATGRPIEVWRGDQKLATIAASAAEPSGSSE